MSNVQTIPILDRIGRQSNFDERTLLAMERIAVAAEKIVGFLGSFEKIGNYIVGKLAGSIFSPIVSPKILKTPKKVKRLAGGVRTKPTTLSQKTLEKKGYWKEVRKYIHHAYETQTGKPCRYRAIIKNVPTAVAKRLDIRSSDVINLRNNYRTVTKRDKVRGADGKLHVLTGKS